MIEINMEQFKKASKKVLNEKKLCNSLASVNEMLSRGLGFRSYNDLKKEMKKKKVRCSPAFNNLSEIEILNNYICSKDKYETIVNGSDKFSEFNYVKDNIWNNRALNSLMIMLKFNKKMYDLGLMDFSFKSLSKLILNFALISEIDKLRVLNIPSKTFPDLTQKDVLCFDFLNELKFYPHYKVDLDNEVLKFVEEKWIYSLLIIKPILTEFILFDENTDILLLNKYLQARESMEKELEMLLHLI